ncbi:MAG: hypothetical protein V2A77_11490 [Pseudomonadota bacterium]
MRALLTHRVLAQVPAVMETPKDAPDADERNMEAARRGHPDHSPLPSGAAAGAMF